MDSVLRFFKKYIVPEFIFTRLQPIYHLILSFLGALFYGFPSRKMIVIGVTGTKGKTTTCNLIAQILNSAGLKTGMATTVNFRIGDKEWVNETKQTMLGRFKLQKLLREMTKNSCKYAVIETSSEGILQYRHLFIDYSVAVFTNLSPEHIERHGGFEKYRAAKIKLFEKVAQKKDGVGIYNLDDKNVEYFLGPRVKNKYGYHAKISNSKFLISNKFQISNIKLLPSKTFFDFDGEEFETTLIGEFNAYNAACAITTAVSQDIPISKIKDSLRNAKPAPGRMEVISQGQNFTVIIDYSYEPKGLEEALKTLKIFNPRQIIALVGSAGGGRDKWRRPVMGEVTDKYADIVVVTTDDPYDDDPEKIVDEVLAGALKNPARILEKNIFRIVDRREAIKKAITIAEKGDVVLLAGKGGEKWMSVADGKKIPWDERAIAEEMLCNLRKNDLSQF